MIKDCKPGRRYDGCPYTDCVRTDRKIYSSDLKYGLETLNLLRDAAETRKPSVWYNKGRIYVCQLSNSERLSEEGR